MKYKFEEATFPWANLEPVRPLKQKVEGKMFFIDQIDQVFKFCPIRKKLLFYCTTHRINV